MKLEDLTTYEAYVEEVGGATLGWLARYGAGRAIWCGELSRAVFRLQSDEVRAGLGNDFGWFLVDYDLNSLDGPCSRVLGKAADERTGLELMRLIIQARLSDSWDRRTSTAVDAPTPTPSRSVVVQSGRVGS